MIRIIVESPFAGDTERNTRYAREALVHSIELGEAPFAAHLLYPQVLDDTVPKERERGLQAGYEWLQIADAVVFYIDFGWSPGMVKALKVARVFGKKVVIRTLFNYARVVEPLDVRELIEGCEAAGLTVVDLT